MKPSRKRYIPPKRYNPEYQAKRIEKIAVDLEIHQRQIQAISASHDNHITHLANFARHDIKNTIQNIDSVLSTTPSEQFTAKTIESLMTYLSVIRNTIDNFAKLVPYSTTGRFKLDDLMVAVELLARADMQKNDIDMIFDYPRQSLVEIDLPFQIVLQMLNNLIINSVKSLEPISVKKAKIAAKIDQEFICIKIQDNGTEISEENIQKIFDYGYSTTGGSGIGLFHAKYLCNDFKGEITIDLTKTQDYNKTFSIKLPLILESNEKDRFNN